MTGWRHVDQVIEQGLPRSMTFANVEFELTRGMVSWQTPESYAVGGPAEPGDVPYAFLDVTAHNRALNVRIDMPDETFRLVSGDGEEIQLARGGFGSLVPDRAKHGFLGFPVTETFDLEAATLVVGARPDTPAVLPLAGDVPDSGFPIDLGITGRVEGPGQLWGSPVTFELLGGTVSKDLVIDRCCPRSGPRADEDELFVTFNLRVIGPSDAYGEQVGSRSVRLVVDGVPREPWYVPLVPSQGGAKDLDAAFVIPSDARSLVLRLGDDTSGTPGEIGIDMPMLSHANRLSLGTIVDVLMPAPQAPRFLEFGLGLTPRG